MTVLAPESEELLRAYRQCFGSPAGQVVMLDLMTFCRFRVPIDGQLDEGKRQAFLRIMNFLSLTPEQLAALYRGQAVITNGEDDNG